MIRRILPLAALLAAVAPTPSGWVERLYSDGAYLDLQNLLTAVTNQTGAAVLDALAFGGATALLVRWMRRFRADRRARWRALGWMAADVVVAASVIYLAFVGLWGLNYRRVPLAHKLEVERSRVTRDGVVAATRRAISELNRLAPSARASPWPSLAGTPDRLAPAYARVQDELWMSARAAPGRPKRSLLEWWFRRIGVEGMTNPFGLEILIDRRVTPAERPFVLAHEWAHLAGYADEAEANFIGWLICQRGDDQARYSGWLAVYPYLLASAPASDRAALARDLGPGPREDLAAIAARLRATTPLLRRATRRVYDRFLQANRVEAGIESYGQVVSLLVGARFESDGRVRVRSDQ